MKYKVIDKDTGKVLYIAYDRFDAEMFMNYYDTVFQKLFNYSIEEVKEEISDENKTSTSCL